MKVERPKDPTADGGTGATGANATPIPDSKVTNKFSRGEGRRRRDWQLERTRSLRLRCPIVRMCFGLADWRQ